MVTCTQIRVRFPVVTLFGGGGGGGGGGGYFYRATPRHIFLAVATIFELGMYKRLEIWTCLPRDPTDSLTLFLLIFILFCNRIAMSRHMIKCIRPSPLFLTGQLLGTCTNLVIHLKFRYYMHKSIITIIISYLRSVQIYTHDVVSACASIAVQVLNSIRILKFQSNVYNIR